MSFNKGNMICCFNYELCMYAANCEHFNTNVCTYTLHTYVRMYATS